MKILDDGMRGTIFFGDTYSFMLLGGQPDEPHTYFILLCSDKVGTPLIPMSREWLQKEIDTCMPHGVMKGGKINQELLDDQLRAYYNYVPEGGGACWNCSLSKVIEIMTRSAGLMVKQVLTAVPTVDIPEGFIPLSSERN